MTRYVRLVEVLVIHDRLLEEFGGPSGVRDPGALESALHRPQTGYYHDLIAEAAALLESLLVNHPFVDGNKRTAVAVVDIFLRLNGVTVTASDVEFYEVVIDMFSRRDDRFTRLDAWLREHTR